MVHRSRSAGQPMTGRSSRNVRRPARHPTARSFGPASCCWPPREQRTWTSPEKVGVVCRCGVSRWRKRFCRGRAGRTEGSSPIGAAPHVRVRGGGWDEGLGVRPTRGPQGPLVVLELPSSSPPKPSPRGSLKSISSSTVRRWLARRCDHALAASFVDLPSRPRRSPPRRPGSSTWRRAVGGHGARPHDAVISADEKSQLQALAGATPIAGGRRTASARRVRIQTGWHLGLHGRYVHNARLIGTVAAKTGITPFMELADGHGP